MLRSSTKRNRPEPVYVLRAHASSVQAVKYVPSFKFKENDISQNDPLNDDQLKQSYSNERRLGVYFSSPIPPGYLFTGDADGMVYLWDLETRRGK